MIITLLSIITALLVVTSTSTVYSVLWLVSTFLIISALLGLLNLGFVALLYIIVYVGAIAILFLFVVQLLDLGAVSEQPLIQENMQYNLTKVSNSTSSKGITPLAIIISLSLITIIISIAFNTGLNFNNTAFESINSDLDALFYDFNSAQWNISSALNTKIMAINSTIISPITAITSVQEGTPQVQAIAEWFYGPGLLPLIIISIILLVAMIAPISLCKDNN